MKNTVLFFAIISLVLSGCETVVDIDIPYESPELVVNSTLVPDSLISLHLSQSQHVLDQSDYKPIEAARVSVYEDGVLLTTLADSTNGIYVSGSARPQRGKKYTVSISKNGFADVDAEVMIPPDTAKIVRVKADTVSLSDFGYVANYLRLGVEIDDDMQTDNYYEISVQMTYYAYEYDWDFNPPTLIDSTLTTTELFLESRDPSLEEYQSYGNKIIFDDKLFNGNVYTMSVLVNEYSYIDLETKPTFTIVLKNTSKSYHLYQLSAQLQYWVDGDPFAQPVQVYNNINNGYGILGAYNQVKYQVK